MSLDRVLLVKAHMALAAFILPVAMLFVITGALYTWGIKGGYETQTILLPLRESMQNNKTWLSALAVQELNRRSLKVSSGVEKIKQAGNSFYFEWTGAKLDVRLESTSNPFVAKLEIKRTN